MSKNKKVMSIAIMPELHDEIKRAAKRKGMSTSRYMGDLAEQAVKLNNDDDPMVVGKPIDKDVQPVVLHVPKELTEDREQLEKWMLIQVAGIVKAMTKPVVQDSV